MHVILWIKDVLIVYSLIDAIELLMDPIQELSCVSIEIREIISKS